MRRWSACTSARRFKNDTERLEKLFELYTQMTAKAPAKKAAKRAKSP